MAKMLARTEFLADTKRYVIVNATDERLEMRDQGMCWSLPPTNVTREPSKFHPVACVSHKDSETGELIPGTLVVMDRSQPTPVGGVEQMVDLDSAVKTALNYDPNTGEYAGGIGLKGVSVVPFTADRATVEQARAEGLERYRQWKVKECIDMVDAHDLRNEARRRANLGTLPPSRDYIKATAALDALREEDVADYRDKFALKVDGQATTKPETPAESKQSTINAILENKELLKMLATAIEANKIADTPGVSDKTAAKIAKVQQDMKEIDAEKVAKAAARTKFKATG